MTVDDFERDFGPGISVCFNWRRFKAEKWPIRLSVMNHRDQFDNIWLPWWLNTNNRFVACGSPNASLIKLGDINNWFGYLPRDMKTEIQNWKNKFKNDFDSGAITAEFDVPLYAPSENHFLVLDGNKRLSALALSRSSLPFTVNRYVVKGPIDQSILPDLVYFAGHTTPNQLSAGK